MFPIMMTELNDMPYNANGKIDRVKLLKSITNSTNNV